MHRKLSASMRALLSTTLINSLLVKAIRNYSLLSLTRWSRDLARHYRPIYRVRLKTAPPYNSHFVSQNAFHCAKK